jgi:hypothetical protein
MLLPTHILPDALGIDWGLPKEQCLQLLNAIPLKQSTTCATVNLTIQESSYKLNLLFNDHNGLERIEVNLYVSRDFWDDDYTSDEMESIWTEFTDHYNYVVEHCSSVLGPPSFSGNWRMEGYPEGQAASNITYWNHPKGRMQIELDHPDKEFPMFVRVVCYPVDRCG